MAGVKAGDVITEIDNKSVNSKSELLEIIGRHRPGDKVDVVILRNGNSKKLTVSFQNKFGEKKIIKKENNYDNTLGAEFETVTRNEKELLRINNGIKIVKLMPGILQRAGVKEGYVITKINDKEISNLNDIKIILTSKNSRYVIEGIYPNRMKAFYAIKV